MDPSTILPFPLFPTEQLDRDLAEIDAAISLVVSGVATRVGLVGLAGADAVAAAGLARAQSAGVHFSLDRSADQPPALIVGPRDQGSS